MKGKEGLREFVFLTNHFFCSWSSIFLGWSRCCQSIQCKSHWLSPNTRNHISMQNRPLRCGAICKDVNMKMCIQCFVVRRNALLHRNRIHQNTNKIYTIISQSIKMKINYNQLLFCHYTVNTANPMTILMDTIINNELCPPRHKNEIRYAQNRFAKLLHLAFKITLG